ncbi:unnamed protein product [Mytilus edulis]|uniref:Uncharacterized protein n=1 Tax=Mytilus edulis TaxID=6550 RepID=A0A8S3RMV7_MYTED|nr:unnamed protein product [Mytilus edulis]
MAGVPDYYERKGSLNLRSDHMNYGRATLNSNWHQSREAEPKNYDINRSDTRNLCNASYNRIGDVTDGSLPKTTYQDHTEQIYLRDDFEEQETKKAMVTMKTIANTDLDRETETPQRGFGSEKLPDFPDQSAAYRKCLSQFTDTCDYRRPGRNTWQDESGTYANTHYKRQIIQSRNPIPEQKA